MSTFHVKVKKIVSIDPHPNAESLEIATIDGYRSVVKKGEFRPGDLVVYIPEFAVLPEWLLVRLGLWDVKRHAGILSGKNGNRLKAARLRGVLSQGICYAVTQDSATSGAITTGPCFEAEEFALVSEGDDVAKILGIVKYEPPVPVAMSGEVFNAGVGLTMTFDVENWKSHPNLIQEGEPVVFTEKLHGTCTIIAVLPVSQAHPEAFGEKRNILIFSKGLGAKGLVFKNNERNKNNLYVRVAEKIISAIESTGFASTTNKPVFILGETFGKGVQDLSYGTDPGFRIFAFASGNGFEDWETVEQVARKLGTQTVPVLYRGPYSDAMRLQYTDGKTSLDAEHIREGIVIVPERERISFDIGRVCLKSVSEHYLLRKGGSEFS